MTASEFFDILAGIPPLDLFSPEEVDQARGVLAMVDVDAGVATDTECVSQSVIDLMVKLSEYRSKARSFRDYLEKQRGIMSDTTLEEAIVV